MLRKMKPRRRVWLFQLTVAMYCGFVFQDNKMVVNALFEGTKDDVRSGEGKQDMLHFIFHRSREEKPHTR